MRDHAIYLRCAARDDEDNFVHVSLCRVYRVSRIALLRAYILVKPYSHYSRHTHGIDGHVSSHGRCRKSGVVCNVARPGYVGAVDRVNCTTVKASVVLYRRTYAGGVTCSPFVQKTSVFCLVLAESASSDLLTCDKNTGAEVTSRVVCKSRVFVYADLSMVCLGTHAQHITPCAY